MEIFKSVKGNLIELPGLSRIIPRRAKKVGKPPGTLEPVKSKHLEDVEINVIDYNKNKISEFNTKNSKDVFKYKNSKSTTWINISGIHDIKLVRSIGEYFDFHPLLMEDIVNTGHRPKIEVFGEHILIILKMITYNDKIEQVDIEHISLVIGNGFVISFQERKGDVFDSVRARLKEGRVRIRSSGSDYLGYALIDVIVDHYFLVLEQIGDYLEKIENNIMKKTDMHSLNLIYKLKRELLILRKSVWPLREVINGFMKEESELIKKETLTFIRDIYDHTIQVIDTVETYRDMAAGMLDLHMSQLSNRMNEVMKVLTIIATIFIPLTFLAGIYGMNFEYMPELSIKWAYPTLLVIMIFIASCMIYYFKRKKWI